MATFGKGSIQDNIFHGRAFRESRLRDQIGPSNPLYHLLRPLTVDMYCFRGPTGDDFDNPDFVDEGIWATGGTSTATWGANATGACGQLTAASDETAGELATLRTVDQYFYGDYRPVMLCRFGMGAAITTSKFEVGFTDGDDDNGAVNAKTTPTSTATDYAVIIRDTAHNTSVDLVTDGTTDAVEKVASSPGITFAVSTLYNFMLAIDENECVRFWIDNVYQGRSARGPDGTVALGLFLAVGSSGAAVIRTGNVDYVRAWQERTDQS